MYATIFNHADLDLWLGHELLHGVDGGADAGDGEEGGEVGGVAAHHQHHEHPPRGHHHPPRHRPEHCTGYLRGDFIITEKALFKSLRHY